MNFPESIEIGKSHPLYKGADHMSFDNYSPVSVMCVLSFVLEKLCLIIFQPSMICFRF